MKNSAELIVIGGGPSGSFTALNLAKHDRHVIVLEEHGQVGIPSHCPGHLSIQGLRDLGLYPLPDSIVENTFRGAWFHSPNGYSFSMHFRSPITCTVNRTLFDKYIAEKAETAGVEYRFDSMAQAPILENAFVVGLKVKRHERETIERAEIVVDAEGISSRILRQTGLEALSRSHVVNGVEADVMNADCSEPDCVEVFFGKDYAPGFYAWLIPRRNGTAKIGLATRRGDPRILLRCLMKKHPVASRRLASAEITRESLHPISLGGPILRAYENGFIAVGDVASQVKPTTGGGVILGLKCGKIAAEVSNEALEENDQSASFLGGYQKKLNRVLGSDMRIMLYMRKMLDSMSDRRIDKTINLCARFNLEEALQYTRDIDLVGKTLLRSMQDPRSFTRIVSFFLSFLLTNF